MDTEAFRGHARTDIAAGAEGEHGSLVGSPVGVCLQGGARCRHDETSGGAGPEKLLENVEGEGCGGGAERRGRKEGVGLIMVGVDRGVGMVGVEALMVG